MFDIIRTKIICEDISIYCFNKDIIKWRRAKLKSK